VRETAICMQMSDGIKGNREEWERNEEEGKNNEHNKSFSLSLLCV
jgi:hypothetical protein